MAEFTIYIGNRTYSSWSLRAWLMLKASGLAFDAVLIPLWQPESKAELLRHSPSGKVPALRHGDVTVWESLAIAEYLAEQAPRADLWPADAAARAAARAVSAEMHAGFLPLRRHLPMNLRASGRVRDLPPDVQADVNRVTDIWRDCRRTHGASGAYLFGAFGIADAMFAPVVSRFRSYGVALTGEARAYADAVWAHPAFTEWVDAARAEPWVVASFEV
ncbi:MAG TPA: glutathione S-transferase family protein [Stellaceae bacterium]|nr:glutathione S-transferase family protein [Stellaceae bacterium]